MRLEKARERLAGRVALEIAWRPFEIHPGVPPEGAPLASLGYEPEELERMMEHLRRQGAGDGVAFAPLPPDALLANTRRALAAGAIVAAVEPRRFEAFHHALFRAGFEQRRNLGDPAVLREVAATAGIDADRLDASVDAGDGDAALRAAADEARRRGIRAVPAFVFGGRETAVGAQPVEELVRAAERAAGMRERR